MSQKRIDGSTSTVELPGLLIELCRVLGRRIRARHWRCRCGRPIFTDGQGCVWHQSVRGQVLDGRIRTQQQAR